MPLLFQPGAHWHYSFNSELVGRLVEIVSGQDFESFLQERIFRPLCMVDTSFMVPESKRGRFCQCYMREGQEAGMIALNKGPKDDRGLRNISKGLDKDPMAAYFKGPSDPNFHASGSGGLVGTVSDYARFSQCMLNGGILDGARILSRKSVQFMTSNQLGRRAGEDLDMRMMSLDMPGYTEIGSPGVGFGLGFSVVLHPALAASMSSPGNFAWGGAASTSFWVDPEEELLVVFATQFFFWDDLRMPLRAQLGNLVYACVADGNVSSTGRASKL
ncbi:unnamed protein product [Polarella glacialis]|uniref:Beta-lactamase-related domain-containing protein n=1 Tax=Polarella glacialis TaxID=89957 RepID=A0A813ES80_POLGL|nr:unnamed protein product [Polarella glacialis]